ncbi:Rho GTPase-activating protein [Dirofilaria immitis]
MGGKPLRNLLCCYHPKAEDIRDELRPISGCYNQTYNAEQISPKQNIDLMRTNKAITLINEKCTYKRNESPQPVEVANLKPNGIKVNFLNT